MTKFGEAVWETLIGLFVLICVVGVVAILAQMGWWALLVPCVLAGAWLVGRFTVWVLDR